MLYKSTRGNCSNVSSAEAIKRGLAADGGLFVPEKIVRFDNDQILKMSNMTYQQRAISILA